LTDLLSATLAVANILSSPEHQMDDVDRDLREADAAYQNGDFATALHLVQPHAEQGDVLAQARLAMLYFFGRGVPQNYVMAAKWQRLAAEQSNVPFFQQWVGNNFLYGRGEPQNGIEAIKWLRKAADQDFAPAQLDLGRAYEYGAAGSPDYAEAIKWYRRAAEQPTSNWPELDANETSGSRNDGGFGDGLAEAQTRLAQFLYSGLGCPRDYVEAAKWYRRAADNGSVYSRCMLGAMYAHGEGVPQDDAEAERLYRAPAERGYPPAQHCLGYLFKFGRAVPQDHEEAVRWFKLAAENGHNEARFELASAFLMGQGVPQSDNGGARWMILAAENCHAEAQRLLAMMYDEGTGVLLDHKLAYAWADVALANGANASDVKSTAAKHLSSAELRRAQQLAEEWKKRFGLVTRH
jgi:TPR repeat protein